MYEENTMTDPAIEALEADREVLLEIGAGLSEADWKGPSGCAGWSVQDVVAHVGTLFWVVVDPSVLPDTSGEPVEHAQDVNVESRRSWTSEQVLADYEAVSLKALDALAGFAGQDFEVPLGDLGTYPASALSSAFAFDHFVHIRSDLFVPRGSLLGEVPPADELRLAPALDWVEAALPQQCAEAIATLSGAVEVDLSGPGARTLRIGTGKTASSVRSDSSSFLGWVTQRASWAETHTVGSGNDADLAVVASFHVF
jgi:uncharacterized protein (TIGR03083 family)